MPAPTFRYAIADDIPILCKMNRALIVEEKHRNNMTMDELIERMRGFLAVEYNAVVFEIDGRVAGHALYRRDPEHFYIRQFYVQPEFRRQGIGRAAVNWMVKNAWSGAPRIRTEVLSWNPVGIAFWHGIGFTDYSLAVETEL